MRFDRLRLNRPETKIAAAAPAWTVTYADFVTVLLCIFVAMLSMSTIRQDRFQTALNSLQQTFGATASLEAAGTPDQSLYARLRPIVEQHAKPNLTATTAESETSWASITRAPGGAKLDFSGPVVFDRGQSEIGQDAKSTLTQLAEIVGNWNCMIVVKGHAAAEAPPDEQSLRDLSYERARNAARILEQGGLAAEKISVVAMGNGEPRLEHAYTEKRRAMNRRVEIEIVELDARDETTR
jgi:chemotaxis protein MotB